MVVILREAEMAGTGLTREQLEGVLLRISQTEHLGLKILDLSWNKLGAVKTSILSSAIIEPESVSLSGSNLTHHQLSRLLSKIV